MTDRENNVREKKRTVVVIAFYRPRRGRCRRQRGDALAVYFAMNISRGLGDIHRSVKVKIVVYHLLLQRHSDQRGGIFVVFLIGQ